MELACNLLSLISESMEEGDTHAGSEGEREQDLFFTTLQIILKLAKFLIICLYFLAVHK